MGTERKSLQIAVVGAIVGVGILFGGIFASSVLVEQNTPIKNTSSDFYSEEINFGANVAIDIYNAQGELSESWNSHNSLAGGFLKNLISACVTGLDTTPHPVNGCSSMINNMKFGGTGGSLLGGDFAPTHTLLPLGCSTDKAASGPTTFCEGWKSEATVDFATLSCTAGTDCPTISSVSSFFLTGGLNNLINSVSVSPALEITPGDRVVVVMTFSFV